MRLLARCSTAEMLWEWALAEWESARFGYLYPDRPDVVERLRSGAPYDRTNTLDRRIVSTTARARDPLLKDMLPARIPWRRAVLAPDELAQLRILNTPEFRRLTPDSPLLPDLAAAILAGRRDIRNLPLPRDYRKARESFDPSRTRGAPILLAQNAAGPFHILEGHHRLVTHLIRHSDGLTLAPEIAVILGLWPGLKSWSWFWDSDAPSQPL